MRHTGLMICNSQVLQQAAATIAKVAAWSGSFSCSCITAALDAMSAITQLVVQQL